jgi:thiol-disulfide isomerase/thioredoxin
MRLSAIERRICHTIARLWIVAWISINPLMADQSLQPLPLPRLAPPFHLPDLQGHFHHLSDFRDRVMIVNFWASWCTPCRKELPSMNRAWARLDGESVVMLAINVGEERAAVEAFVQDFPIDFLVLLDDLGNLSQRWQVRGLPTSFVLNGRGEMVYQLVGEKQWDDEDLLRQVRELIPAHEPQTKGSAAAE